MGTLFRVEVSPANGAAPWTVRRRYNQFFDFFSLVRPRLGRLALASFPRKGFRPCIGDRLESRRSSLEVWLNEVLRQAQASDFELLDALCLFVTGPVEHPLPQERDTEMDDTQRWRRRGGVVASETLLSRPDRAPPVVEPPAVIPQDPSSRAEVAQTDSVISNVLVSD